MHKRNWSWVLIGGALLLGVAGGGADLLAARADSGRTGPAVSLAAPQQGTPTPTRTPCPATTINGDLVPDDDLQNVSMAADGVADTCAVPGYCDPGFIGEH